MNTKKIKSTPSRIIYQQNTDNRVLQVKENNQYRWLEYAGDSVQSLMNISTPEQPVMPVCQACLLFLLWKKTPLSVLNLGLGGAAIDRVLATFSDIAVTSVDASQAIIEVAKKYFKLPGETNVVCEKAERFILNTKDHYDVVLCDLFIGEKNPECLFEAHFYNELIKIGTSHLIVMINLKIDNNDQLLHTLQMLNGLFPHIVIMEFNNYSNIVLACSANEIPNKTALQAKLENFNDVIFTCLDEIINKMHYLPARPIN